ncbi:HDOD domain-containing protein [Planctomicrobium sp. SH664]|uniref:HDOD domain-containing protein n=1 Tax=Planctomicrobium sp. SH664 TaxID=3448125 RepID=UPI003F5BEECD
MTIRRDAAHRQAAPHFDVRPALQDLDELLAFTTDDDVSFARLERELGSRPLIAAHLMRSATSAGLGAYEVRSLRHALALLGMKRIRETLRQLQEKAQPERRAAAG